MNPLARHFCFPTFWGSTFSTLFFSVFLRVYKHREASHLFFREISRRKPSESCLGTPWGPSYEHMYKNLHFCKGKGREGTKGREGKGKKGRGREGKGREGKGKGKGRDKLMSNPHGSVLFFSRRQDGVG